MKRSTKWKKIEEMLELEKEVWWFDPESGKVKSGIAFRKILVVGEALPGKDGNPDLSTFKPLRHIEYQIHGFDGLEYSFKPEELFSSRPMN